MSKQAFRPPKPVQRPIQTQALIQTQSQSQTQTDTRQDVSTTGVTQQQSLRMTQKFLNMAVALICYERALLPNANFVDEVFDTSGDPGSNTPSQEGIKLPAKQIKLDYSDEGRLLVEAINGGVIDALSKGYLKSLILAILLDPDSPESVIESSAFHFTYTTGGQAQMSLDGAMGSLDLSLPLGEPSTTATTQDMCTTAFKKLFKRILVSCRELDDLPDQRHIDVKLLYNETTPLNYEPPGFVSSTGHSFMMATYTEEDKPYLRTAGSVQTGHHGISFSILSATTALPWAYLKRDRLESFEGNGTEAPTVIWDAEALSHTNASDRLIPSGRQVLPEPLGQRTGNGRLVSSSSKVNDAGATISEPGQFGERISTTDYRRPEAHQPRLPGWSQFDATQTQISMQETAPWSAPRATQPPRDINMDNGGDGPSPGRPNNLPNHAGCPPLPSLVDQSAKQLRQGRNVPSKITRSAQNAKTIPASKTLQKGGGKQKKKPKPKSKSKSSNAKKPTSIPDQAQSRPQPKPKNKKPSEGKNSSLSKGKKTSLPTGPAKQPETADWLNCYCGSNVVLDQSTQCESCHRWLHVECAGFLSIEALPKDFDCLECLIEEQMEDGEIDMAAVKGNLMSLSIFRRALVIVRDAGSVPDMKLLQTYLGGTATDIRGVTDRLSSEGFVELQPMSRGARQSAQWVRSNSQSVAFARYFSPGGEIETQMFPLRATKRTFPATKTLTLSSPVANTDIEEGRDASPHSPTQPSDRDAAQPEPSPGRQNIRSADSHSARKRHKSPSAASDSQFELTDVEPPHKRAKSSKLLRPLDFGIPSSGWD